MSSNLTELQPGGHGALSLQLDKLTIERDKVAASLRRLDPSGELRPIWNMLKNPSRSGHGYWDLLGMDQHVYEQHPPETPGVAIASSATRERRRDHGLLLAGRLAELNHDIVALERKLRPVEPALVENKFVPAARPQQLVALQVLQCKFDDRTPDVLPQLTQATASLRAKAALQEELDTLRAKDARLQAALDRLDPTKELRALWLEMNKPVKSPRSWFDQVDLERKLYASTSHLSSTFAQTPTDEQVTSRRSQGLLLLGRLAELSHEIADAERELSDLENRPHALSPAHRHRSGEPLADALSIGHVSQPGGSGPARYRASAAGRALRW